MNDIYQGDCIEVRTVLADNSVDTIITDPPYGLEFMGKGWDKGVPGVEYWKEFLAVTKPGGMLLAFGGTRTYHRMVCAIEDAGWEIRDCMMWLYGSGFPKSLDISKAIDKANGADRAAVGKSARHGGGAVFAQGDSGFSPEVGIITAPATDLSREWSGWGTALKPAWEPIIVAMKPLDGTFAQNAEKWGVAGINVDGGRIGTDEDRSRPPRTPNALYGGGNGTNLTASESNPKGRWPANLLLDEDAAAMLDEQSGALKSGDLKPYTQANTDSYSGSMPNVREVNRKGDSGGASRFFYCAKASKSERNAGCEGLPLKELSGTYGEFAGDGRGRQTEHTPAANHHPTVKPLKLMEYLCTLTKTPTGGIVLDPFAGSGTTLLAAKNTGRQYVGIEKDDAYFQIIQARLAAKEAA